MSSILVGGLNVNYLCLLSQFGWVQVQDKPVIKYSNPNQSSFLLSGKKTLSIQDGLVQIYVTAFCLKRTSFSRDAVYLPSKEKDWNFKLFKRLDTYGNLSRSDTEDKSIWRIIFNSTHCFIKILFTLRYQNYDQLECTFSNHINIVFL